MAKILRILPALLLSTSINAQQVLFSEDFEGAQHGFTLNTSDMGSQTSGANTWLVNNAYSGGSSTLDCLGIPFTFTIPNTAAQPAGITQPNGKYMHITSNAAMASGIANCNFAAADGLCTAAGNHFARMTTDVATTGADEVALSFWWLCAGSASNYGEVYYSTNGGTSWNQVTTPLSNYANQPGWVQQTITLPAFADQATLRFGFRFVNGTTMSASDPAFGIDDVKVTSTQAANTLTTGAVVPASICPKSAFDVPFTATGTWNAGNFFSAQLSDANGSFAQPINIGMWFGTTSGTIVAEVPSGVPTGPGYLIRVVGSDPQVDGVDSPTPIIILVEPYAGQDSSLTVCEGSAPFNLFTALGGTPDAGGSWSFNGFGTAAMFSPAVSPAGCYAYSVAAQGCPNDTARVCIALDPCLGVASVGAGAQSLRWLGQQGTVHVITGVGVKPDAVALFDIAGRSVAVQLRNAMEGRLLLDMAAMPDGPYLLRVTDAGRAGVVRLLHRQ